jgi:diguanylate cyclase (GGDEF)-like protein
MSASPTHRSATDALDPAEVLEARLAVDKQDGREETSFESIGLSPKAGWYVTASLNFVAGVLMITLLIFTDTLPAELWPLSIAALVSAPFALLGAKFFPYASWGSVARGGTGLLLIAIGGLLIGPPITAMAFLALFPLLGVAYLHKPSVSIPFTACAIIGMPIIIGLSAPIPYTIVATLVMAMLATAAIFSQNQLRMIASVTRDLSVTDPLTGLANLRRLQSRAQDAMLASARNGEPTLMFAIDLDDFKQVNDRFDHTRGDDLLKAVGEALTDVAEGSDMVARRGGDEFAVLVPTCAGRDPEQMRIQFVRAIREARMHVCPEVNPEGSVAYVRSELGESVDELIQRADDALHEAKLDAHPERRLAADFPAVPIERALVESGRRRDREHTADHLATAGAAQAAEELRIARWAQRSLGTAMAWEQAAAMSLIIGTLLAVFSISGLVESMHGWDTALPVGALLVMPFGFVFASKRQYGTIPLGFCLAAMLAALTFALLSAGDARWQLVDLYLVPTMFAMFFMKSKRAVVFLVGGLALYSVLLWTTTYPYSPLRIASTITLIVIMAGMLAKARGITRSFTKKAVEMSVVDPLTGVANLRGLRQRIGDEIERCNATGKQLALLAIDLDDFKAVNDTYSHTRGDEVLVATALAIRDQVRADELVARRGGDEFAAVCVFDDENAPHEVALRVADAIAETRVRLCPDTLPTASVGYIVWLPGESIESFLSRADRELHGAKERSHAVRVA